MSMMRYEKCMMYPLSGAVVSAKMKKFTWSDTAFIDPGVMGTGIAFWETLRRGKPSKPDASGSWLCMEGTTRHRRHRYGQLLLGFLQKHRVKHLIIEYPEMWSGSAKSWSATVRGDLFALATLIGIFESKANFENCSLLYVKPREWKAQLSKEAIEHWVYGAIKTKYSTTHELEAVAMGLFAARVLKEKRCPNRQ